MTSLIHIFASLRYVQGTSEVSANENQDLLRKASALNVKPILFCCKLFVLNTDVSYQANVIANISSNYNLNDYSRILGRVDLSLLSKNISVVRMKIFIFESIDLSFNKPIHTKFIFVLFKPFSEDEKCFLRLVAWNRQQQKQISFPLW